MPENSLIPLDRTPETVKVDNFLRRALKVRDPDDPGQVARALLERSIRGNVIVHSPRATCSVTMHALPVT